MDNYFNVFKNGIDQVRWENHIQFAASYPELSDQERKEMVAALKFLQRELGNKFLKVSHFNHPLVRRVLEKAPWRAYEIIDLYKTLLSLKNTDSNYQKLHSKLISRESCEIEGIPFIEIAQDYLNAGFSVRFIDEVEQQSNPDMLISDSNSGQQFFIEVSRLGDSKVRNKAKASYDRLYEVFNNGLYHVPYSCCQLTDITDIEMPVVIQEIHKLLERVISEREFLIYNNGKIRLGAAHPDKYHQLEQCIEVNNYRKGLLGLSLNFNETRRISDYKIPLKSTQLKMHGCGIIYIPANSIYFWKFNFEEAVSNMRYKMKNHNHILGTAVYGYQIDDAMPFVINVDGNFYSMKKMYNSVSRYFIFIYNPAYSRSLTNDIIKKIYTSFE